MALMRQVYDLVWIIIIFFAYTVFTLGCIRVFVLMEDQFITHDSFALMILLYFTKPFVAVLPLVGLWLLWKYTDRKFIRPGHIAWLLRASQRGSIVFPDPDARMELAEELAEMKPQAGENILDEICGEYGGEPKTHRE